MSRLLLDEYPLIVLPSLANLIGLNEAIVLQQVHYWLEQNKKNDKQSHYREGKWWCYNTLAEWHEKTFTFWSFNTVQRTFTTLKNKGLLLATDRHNKFPQDRTLWYSIDYKTLYGLYGQEKEPEEPSMRTSSIPNWENGDSQNGHLIPETNKETNKETVIAYGDRNALAKYLTLDNETKEFLVEPTYAALGNEFEEDEKTPSRKSLMPKNDLEVRALTACGRKYFRGEEAFKFRMIAKSAVPYGPQTRDAKYHIEWIESCIEWAEKKNNNHKRNLGRGVAIQFPQLLTAIKNEDSYMEWISKKEKEIL